MKASSFTLASTLFSALGALAGPLKSSEKRWKHSPSPWTLVDDWVSSSLGHPRSPLQIATTDFLSSFAQSGQDFFSHWTFYNDTDPTQGTVVFLDEDTAWQDNLIDITSSGHAIMRVETTKNVTSQGGRKAIRLHGERM